MIRTRILAVVTALVLTVGMAQAAPCSSSIQNAEKAVAGASPEKQQAAQKYIDQAKAADQAGNAKQCKAAVKHAKSALATKAKKHQKAAKAAK